MMRHRFPLIVIGLVLAGGASAIALAGSPVLRSLRGDGQSPHVKPMLYAHNINHVPAVTTGTAAQRVQAIVARSQVDDIASAQLAHAPAGAAGYDLNLHLRIPTYGPTALRTLWQAEVTEGAIAESLAYTNAGPLVSTTITGELPNGQQIPLPSGVGNVAASQTYSDASDEAIKASVSSAVKSAGLTLTSVSILRADQPAPAVIVEAQDQKEAEAKEASLTRTLFFEGTTPSYEGYYLEFDDPSGHPLVIDRASFRTGITGRWTATDQVKNQSQP